MQLAVETATRHFGRLDAVVACAGVVAGGAPIWEVTDAAWDAVWSVNVLGTRRLIEAAAPTLIANGPDAQRAHRRGRLGGGTHGALTTSPPTPRRSTPSSDSFAAPRWTSHPTASPRTPSVRDRRAPRVLDASATVYGLASPEEFAQHQPIGRLIEPVEVAASIAWLCSPAASAITGADVAVDGGMTIG